MIGTFIITSLTFLVLYAFYYDAEYTERYVWLAGYAGVFLTLVVAGLQTALLLLLFLVLQMAGTWLVLAWRGAHD
jgi:hypothetical protein